MSPDIDPFAQKFLQLQADYVAQLPKKIAAIQDIWTSLKARHSVETIDLLYSNIHALIGTSGTFGFSALSHAARNLEASLKPLLEHSTQNFSFNTEVAASISANIHYLFSLVDIIQQELATTKQK